MQFAFHAVAGIQPLSRAMAKKPVSVTLHRSSALTPLDHPPKLAIVL